MALAEHLCAQPTAGGDAEAVSLTLPAAVQQAASHSGTRNAQPFGPAAARGRV